MYYEKYLKYKNKYFILKNQLGGSVNPNNNNKELLRAIEENNFDLVKLLVKDVINLNYFDNLNYVYKYESPLALSIKKKNLELVKYLVDNGANVNFKFQERVYIDSLISMLEIAIIYNSLEIIKYLIEKGANIEDTNIEGSTALIIAINEGRPSIVKYLIEIGANIEHRDKSGRTPIMHTIDSISSNIDEKFEIIKYLIERGANTETCFEIEDEKMTLLEYAFDMVDYSSQGTDDFFKTIKFLIENNVSFSLESLEKYITRKPNERWYNKNLSEYLKKFYLEKIEELRIHHGFKREIRPPKDEDEDEDEN